MTNPAQNETLTTRWAIILAIATIGVFALAVGLISSQEDAKPTFRVKWVSKQAKLNDNEVPSLVFRHDAERDELIHRGAIDQKRRAALLELKFDDVKRKDTRLDEEIITYRQSIEKLAFLSNVKRASLGFLMLLTALGGIVGVQARSISYFILHACVKNDLNLNRWWAWYGLRPLLGMIFGPLVVLLIMTGLLPRPDVPQTDTLTMFVLSILVGSVASMFFDKLVQLAQTLFGLNADDATAHATSRSAPKPVKASGEWDNNKTVIRWEASTEAKLDRYEVRMSPKAIYDPDDFKVIAKPKIGEVEYSTPDHPAAGETATFKVYVILKNTKESGSEAIPVKRPPANEG